ncbi:hypothetical protein EJB05_54618 [Eragrostis curvula]|uniref:Uncharacterized protein n=1 Tax=Eragrostis curvula TaxID=38414 RepID=A0A5J9SLW6_9POAL|nr:hypothetical protein EJB05_54618 [Eragrostis curvula]
MLCSNAKLLQLPTSCHPNSNSISGKNLLRSADEMGTLQHKHPSATGVQIMFQDIAKENSSNIMLPTCQQNVPATSYGTDNSAFHATG